MVLLIIANIVYYKDQAIISTAKFFISRVFSGSQVSVKKARLGLSGLKLEGILIRNPGFPYEIRLQDFDFALTREFFTALKTAKRLKIKGVNLAHLNFSADAAGKLPQDFLKTLTLGKKSFFTYGKISLSDINAKVNLKDISTDLKLALDLSFADKQMKIDKIFMQSKLSSFFGCRIDSLLCDLKAGNANNKFSIDKITVGKARASDIEAKINLIRNSLDFADFKCRLFNGLLGGSAFLELQPVQLIYGAKLTAKDLDLAELARNLELQDKVEMSGLFSGDLFFCGNNSNVQQLEGSLTSSPEGGKFVIKDANLLATLKNAGNEKIQLTLDALKDYTYTKGKISLKKDYNDVVIEIILDGDKGKIVLPLVFHNVI